MIEIAGLAIAWETVLFVLAFVGSEVIGSSKLKENSVAQLIKTLIDNLKPMRKEDEKVAEVKKAAELLATTLRQLQDD